MNTKHIVNLSRRRFIAGSAVSLAGLTLGVIPSVRAGQREAGPGIAGAVPDTAGDFSPNAFLRIDAEGVVTVISKHLEMGQGTYTGMATLVAEELPVRRPVELHHDARVAARRVRRLEDGDDVRMP